MSGQVSLQDVTFSYPSRPAAPVLRNMDFSFATGRTVALVGASGCGKSTVLQLLLRFYEPDTGAVVRGLWVEWVEASVGLIMDLKMNRNGWGQRSLLVLHLFAF